MPDVDHIGYDGPPRKPEEVIASAFRNEELMRQAVLAAAGVADRCRLEAGDCFTAVPPGGDIYILSWILHD